MAKTVSKETVGFKGKYNPFPGLRPFTPAESDLFFGREGQSGKVLDKLNENRFVTVIGSSGSGKSSLIYCGVIPKLMDMFGEDIKDWQVLNMRPGNDPIGNLVDVFANNAGASKKKELDRSDINDIIRKDQNGLVNTVEKIKEKKESKFLLLVDQFEELFRYRSTSRSDVAEDDSKAFVNLLVDAVNQADSGLWVIITMRSDFIGECAHFQGLTELINNSNYLVPHMAEDNYRKAITGPIEYVGASIEAELVDILLKEIGKRTDQLPVLQHALMRTWDHWQSLGLPDEPISITNYDAIGQMSEAMSRHANEAYEELDNKGKEICESLFKTITEKGSDNKGVRHPTRVDTVASIAKCSSQEIIGVIEVFRLGGRSFITPGPEVEINKDTVIDISHESIMRVWDRLSEWVEKEASSVQMYLRLSEAAAMFQEGKTTLWRPPDLQLALNWRSDNMPTLTWAERFNPAFERAMVYLRTSEKEYISEEENKIKAQKRQLRRSRITAIILGTAAIISVFFMLYAVVKQAEAEKSMLYAEEQKVIADGEAFRAERNADTAQMNAVLAQEQTFLAEANADSARMSAIEALRQKANADASAIEADKEKENAVREAARATTEQKRAEASEKTAIENETEATRLRMVSIGKSMSIKSLQASGLGDLQSLLAYQAYLFNKRNDGIDNDADIYMGLYNVAKSNGGFNYKTLAGHNGLVNSIVFKPDEGVFFTSAADGKVLRWNSKADNPAPQTIFEGNEIIEVLNTSPDGKLLACGSDQSVVRIIPLNGSEMAYELKMHTGKVKALAFLPDNSSLISAGQDGKVILWDLKTREPEQLIADAGKINSLDISDSGKYLVCASDSGQLLVWDIEARSRMNTLYTDNGQIWVVKFREEDLLAVGYENGMIELWDIEDQTVKESVRGHTARVTDICFNQSLMQMATASFDGMVKIWNYNDLTEPPISLDDNDGFVFSLSFSPDGTLILTGSSGNISNQNLIVRPTHVDYMVQDICNVLSRNFSYDEWELYVGRDIDYEETCSNRDLSIKVEERKSD